LLLELIQPDITIFTVESGTEAITQLSEIIEIAAPNEEIT
jgi:hypothetical protein